MSYILEALKKLEEKRRRVETTRDLLTANEAAPFRFERRTPWHYILLAALILNAGSLLWWLRPWQPATAHRPGDHVESAASPAPPVPETMVRPKRETMPHKIVKGAPADEKRDINAVPDPPSRQAAAERTDPESAKRENAIGVDRKVYTLSDLPPSVRQDLPAVTVAGHFYATDPSSRVVVINGKTVHEGQAITGSLRLERVTPDGVILNFQGYRFSRGVF